MRNRWFWLGMWGLLVVLMVILVVVQFGHHRDADPAGPAASRTR